MNKLLLIAAVAGFVACQTIPTAPPVAVVQTPCQITSLMTNPMVDALIARGELPSFEKNAQIVYCREFSGDTPTGTHLDGTIEILWGKGPFEGGIVVEGLSYLAFVKNAKGVYEFAGDDMIYGVKVGLDPNAHPAKTAPTAASGADDVSPYPIIRN